MKTLISICPHAKCTRKDTCRTEDYRNCPIYQEFELNRSLFPRGWDVGNAYEHSLRLIGKRLNRQENVRGDRL